MADVLFPVSLDQALDLLAKTEAPAVLAGGTDLLVQVRQGKKTPGIFVSLDRIEGAQEILETETEIIIRAGAPLARIMAHPAIRDHGSVLAQALAVLGSPQIRNMGTLGGNIMTASPAGDSLPPLYALDARVQLAGPEGFRRMPVRDFIQGPGKTALAPGEILWQANFTKPAPGTCHWFEKVGQRTALSISMVSLAALFRPDPDGRVSKVSLAWGSVGPTIVESPETETFLLNKPLTREVLAGAGDLARQAVRPISDIRATADFRRQVAGNLLMRLETPAKGKRLTRY
ncbi:FAD binding domain-containing protein [Desulfobacter vibrioformis]|uniref:FAD binding domain-containing protein n=1 Tax=Desulfobacter vibrioformis TaxID=34031 RepID=UPI000ABA2BF2|nr:FAD binding domain-containing protein [Desulfobacter vibrioformis]